MLAQAQRRVHHHDRILSAAAPDPQDVEAWLSLWTPELDKDHTSVVVRDVDALPLSTAERLRDLVVRARSTPGCDLLLAMTAENFEDIPAPLARLVQAVVRVPPLRERPDDVLPLARHIAARVRGRTVDVTAAAARTLHSYPWPGNVDELSRVIREAASRTDEIDVRHLPPEVLSGTKRRLSRIEAFERDEIVRVLTLPGVTMREATDELGISRATIYRKLAQYDIHLPKL
ncbi:hypothetical protein BH11ACT8_BH11ACT8_15130 [soil metagenome]